MKFSDIKMFPHCNYSITIDWKYLDKFLDDSIKEYDLNLNPDFQRAHVWTQEQQEKYVEYRLRGGVSGGDIYLNHPGWMSDFSGEYVIVDGKQRLEAVRCFMKNEIKAFGLYYNQFEGPLRIHQGRFGWNIAALKTREEVLQWYLDFNSGGSVHTQEELSKVRQLLEMEVAKKWDKKVTRKVKK